MTEPARQRGLPSFLGGQTPWSLRTPKVSPFTCTSAQGSTDESFHHCSARVTTIPRDRVDAVLNARTPASNPTLKSHHKGLLSRVTPDTRVFTWVSQQAGPEAEDHVVLLIRECNPW